MALKDKLATALLTDMGCVRTNNEDAVAEDADIGLLVLADGMGGYNAGEIASGIAVSVVLETVRNSIKNIARGTIDGTTGYSAEALLLRHAIETAHTSIYHVSQSQPQCAGMGTTLVVAIFHNERVSIGYVGDSRLYRLRDGVLDQITRDHSLVEELIDRGHYTRDEASRLVRKNIVTRAVGVEPEVNVDLIEEAALIGDTVLLCSDGLTDMVEDDTIRAILVDCGDKLEVAAQQLIDTANANGGKDNISVVIARLNAPLTRPRGWMGRLMEWF